MVPKILTQGWNKINEIRGIIRIAVIGATVGLENFLDLRFYSWSFISNGWVNELQFYLALQKVLFIQ